MSLVKPNVTYPRKTQENYLKHPSPSWANCNLGNLSVQKKFFFCGIETISLACFLASIQVLVFFTGIGALAKGLEFARKSKRTIFILISNYSFLFHSNFRFSKSRFFKISVFYQQSATTSRIRAEILVTMSTLPAGIKVDSLNHSKNIYFGQFFWKFEQ
jgi:hypothetical protein